MACCECPDQICSSDELLNGHLERTGWVTGKQLPSGL